MKGSKPPRIKDSDPSGMEDAGSKADDAPAEAARSDAAPPLSVLKAARTSYG